MHIFQFFTSHNQFYIGNKTNSFNEDVSWDNSSFESWLEIKDHLLGIRTESYDRIKCEIKLLQQENFKIDTEQFNHVVEGGLHINSGILQILNCPDRVCEFEMKVIPGSYRLRISSLNLEPDNGEDGEDFFSIEIWPSKDLKRKVVK